MKKILLITTILLAIATCNGCGFSEAKTETEVLSSETTSVEDTNSSEVETQEKTEIPTETETPEETEIPTETETPEETETPTETETPVEPEVPVYTYKELNVIMYAKSSVNVRDLPSVDGKKMGTLSKAQEVLVTGQCNETEWFRIDYNGKSAYVSDSYLLKEPLKETEKEESKEEDDKEVVYSIEDLDGDGYSDLPEYTTWNGMKVNTWKLPPDFVKFKRDLCYAGLYKPMIYTDSEGEYCYMLLDKMDEAEAKKRFNKELNKINVAAQIISVSNWTEDGSVLLAFSRSFVHLYEFEVNVEETLYNMEFYVKATGTPMIDYWLIVMNGYEEDTFPYITLDSQVTFPGEEYACVLPECTEASLPDENGEYYLVLKYDELKPGKYIFSGRYCGGMEIIDYGLVEDQS